MLVGINLLREGLDLPEYIVASWTADKEGFLRSDTSLIQTIGRAARNVDGTVIMYADEVTDSMKQAIGETQRRRKIQIAYNREHDIDPQSIRKKVSDILSRWRSQRRPSPRSAGASASTRRCRPRSSSVDPAARGGEQGAKDLRFEYAARLRDESSSARS